MPLKDDSRPVTIHLPPNLVLRYIYLVQGWTLFLRWRTWIYKVGCYEVVVSIKNHWCWGKWTKWKVIWIVWVVL